MPCRRGAWGGEQGTAPPRGRSAGQAVEIASRCINVECTRCRWRDPRRGVWYQRVLADRGSRLAGSLRRHYHSSDLNDVKPLPNLPQIVP
jgi:hypothetical protein